MNRRFLCLLAFVLAFQVEVRVRASEEVTSIPENCFGKSTPCSFRVSDDKWSYEAGRVKIHATRDTILTELVKSKEWKLVEGTLWVENAPSAMVKTVSADIEGSSGQYWVMTEKERIIVRNISSKLVVTFRDQSKMEIPRGFEIWIGAVNSQAKVEHGMIEAVDLKQHLKSWYELYSGTRQQFVSEVQDLKDQWSDLIEQSGDIYKKVAERELAALDDGKRRAQLEKQKEEQERLRVRETFRKKVFEY